ncbi:MAG: GNAT family N-acetyltransferase [Candidatus Latescibacteria bacterium]|nr:GNAT family N-acetyltransferase [Candidatus Latescibacterota bacterium]
MVAQNLKSLTFTYNENEEASMLANSEIKKPREIRYQILNDYEDIKSCLRLRYISYRYVNFIEENKDRLDIDAYDPYSTFLGAYDVTDGKRILVGTMRIISINENSKNISQIAELISNAHDPHIKELDNRPELFPIMESFILPDSYHDHLNTFKNGHQSFHPYEISRLAVRPDYWMHNVDVGLHHLLVLDSWLNNPPRNDFLIAVHPRSRRRYERVGFEIIPGTKEVLYKHIDQLAIAMVLDLEEYLKRPKSYKETCEALLPHYKEHHYFSRITERRQIERRIKERRKEEKRKKIINEEI